MIRFSVADIYRSRMKKEFLYNIQDIDNISSIFKHGLLSHNAAAMLKKHKDISNAQVQRRREKLLANGIPLHDYANVYFDYWNPMLCAKKEINDRLCILAIDPEVLNIDGCLVTDKNASAGDAEYYYASAGFNFLDFKAIYYVQWFPSAKQKKQAEVLVPNRIDPSYVNNIIVHNEANKKRLERLKCVNVPVFCRRECFF